MGDKIKVIAEDVDGAELRAEKHGRYILSHDNHGIQAAIESIGECKTMFHGFGPGKKKAE
jgi:hypothetical protein